MTDAYNELSNQLGWCITTKDALEEMRASCASAANNVDATLNILRQANFRELNDPLEVVYPKFQEVTRELYREVLEVNVPYIQKQTTAIANILDRLHNEMKPK